MISFNDSVRLVMALEILVGSGDGSGIGLGWYGQMSRGGGSTLALRSLRMSPTCKLSRTGNPCKDVIKN